jgi:hypothetical protein
MSDSTARIEKIVDLSLLKPKNQLLKAQKLQDLVNIVKQKAGEFPATHNLKICQEFLLMVCNLVEEVVKKSEKINKKELVINVLKNVLTLSEAESKIVDSSIEFLWGNDLIRKVVSSKKLVRWLKKKGACLL